MLNFLSSSCFFAIALTLLIWRIANALQKKTGSVLLHPILVSVAAIIVILVVSGIPNSAYQQGMKPLSWLMTPATVCLAVPLYEQVKVLKKNLPAILMGVLCGTLTSLLCVGGLCLLHQIDGGRDEQHGKQRRQKAAAFFDLLHTHQLHAQGKE